MRTATGGYEASARLLPGDLTAEPDPATGTSPRSVGDWLIDVAAFLLAAGWVALMGLVIAAGQVPITGLLVADLVAGVAATGVVWLRRRWPVGVAAVLLPTGVFSMSSGLAAIIALFTVAVRRRYPVAIGFGALYAATAIPFFAFHANPFRVNDSFLSSVLWASVFTALVVAWGMFARARRQLLLSLRDRAHRAEAEQQLRTEQARHLERERIAREMHDVLAHRISLVSMHAGALEFRTDASPVEVSRAAGVIRQSAHQALQDLREVIGVLRAGSAEASPDPPQPILADLPALLDESRLAGARVGCDNQLTDPTSVPTGLGRHAYRVVQEGLTNARKHAPGTAVEVSLAGAPGAGLTVSVRNRKPVGGAGGSLIPGSGTGLTGLRERAQLAGGRLEYGPTTEGGFQVSAWLPWPV